MSRLVFCARETCILRCFLERILIRNMNNRLEKLKDKFLRTKLSGKGIIEVITNIKSE